MQMMPTGQQGESEAGSRRMSAVGNLQHDHTRLRQILALVEGTMHVGAPARPILEEACVALTGQLEQHIARENPAQIRSMTHVVRGPVAKTIPNHKKQARQLRALSHDLIVNKAVMPQDIDTTLYAIIEDLQQQMEEQEEWLFPLAGHRPGGKRTFGLHESATVNRLTHLYPAARRVFEQLGVDTRLEGSDELEEVAWRRGLDTRTLLEQLDQAIRSTRH